MNTGTNQEAKMSAPITVAQLKRQFKVTPAGAGKYGSVYKPAGNAGRNVKQMSEAKLLAIVLTPPQTADEMQLHDRAIVEAADRIARQAQEPVR
jgi:hypothetical protein